MKTTVKKNITVGIFVVILIDVVIGCLLFKSRSFSHLTIWNIIESNKQDDFYWQPEDAPGYFHFEPNSDKIFIFRNEISSLIKNESNEFKMMLEIAKYVMSISSHNLQYGLSLKWDSPEEMLRQIKKGVSANCFHRAILFSTYLSSLGMKSRLWALENENFNATAHSVNEVYIKGLKKWVFIDVMLDFYVTENGSPLSLLELRERLLDGSANAILVHNIRDEVEKQKQIPVFYNRLIKCVFLRANNDFVDKYNNRYGIFSILHKYIDRFPDDIRRGLSYLLGRRDVFIHYVDRYSRSLKPEIITTKLFFYFFVFSLVSIGVLLVIFILVFLKRCLAINLSKKDTRHR